MSAEDASGGAASTRRSTSCRPSAASPASAPIPPTPPACAAAAAWLAAELLRRAGLEHVEICRTGGHPAVLADWLQAPGAPTVLVYGHYDVQPPDPLGAWRSRPSSPTVRDGRLYARGASDDKGPLLIPILVAEAFLPAEGRLPVNLKFLIEGEEEMGSAHLGAFVDGQCRAARRRRAGLGRRRHVAHDLPSVTVASRGICALEVTVRGAAEGPAFRPPRRQRPQPAARASRR